MAVGSRDLNRTEPAPTRRSARRISGLLLAALVACACGGSSSTPVTPLPANTSGWWRDQVGYEIFVRSFADSDGDGIGDLKGLTARLPALNDGAPAASTNSLGVDFIWLMPIFPSPSYHGYDVTDYRAVNPQYGTLADFDALITEARARHLRVILDLTLNHSSSQHPWFVDSRSGATAAKRDWYVWSPTDPGWVAQDGHTHPFRYWSPGNYFYANFGADMPDLNLRNAAVEAELVDTMKFWLARGVSGFRLDAVRYFVENGGAGLMDQPETHAFIQRVRAALQGQYPETLLVAEAWADPEISSTYYGAGNEAQLAFSFGLNDAMVSASQSGYASYLGPMVDRFAAALDPKDRGFQAPFLSNHDGAAGRGVGRLGWNSPQARVAAATLMAMPGTPFLYYGDEIGMVGQAAYGDAGLRTPFPWSSSATGRHGFTTATATWFDAYAGVQLDEPAGVELETQRADPASLYNLFRNLIKLRHAQPPLARGSAARLTPSGGGNGAFAQLRTWQGKRVLFVANYAATACGAFTVGAGGTPVVLLDGGLGGAPTGTATTVTVPGLAASSFAFLSLD
jgi:alpha-amylase